MVKKKRKEVIIAEFEDFDPCLHAGRYEIMFEEEYVAHCMMTKLDWKGKGKVKITIEEL